MRPRFLADADLRFGIVRGLRKREPAVEFLPAQGRIPDSMQDPDVLRLAASLDHVLVSHDFETMPGHIYRFLETRESTGLILIPQFWPIGRSIEELHIVWACAEPEDLRNRIIYVPL